jgi:hypothetical protein
MPIFLITIVAIIYFAVSIQFFLKGNCPMGIVFLSYSVSNVGLCWASV